MNLHPTTSVEVSAVEAGRAKLPEIAERLRCEATRLAALRQSLPLPEERVLSTIYESETGLDAFPSVTLAMDLEFLADAFRRLASQVERTAHGGSPGS